MDFMSMLFYFMIYSFVGWVIEVAYHAVTMGKVVNRGFLNGPICPVYGVGVSLVLVVMQGLARQNIETSNPLVLFAVGIVLATLAELVAGFLLDKLFHARWWDYSNEKFNLNGYICLSFSIVWGLAIAFVLRVVQPVVAGLVAKIPPVAGYIILAVLYIVFVIDIILTTLSVLKFNKQLEQMSDLRNAILKVSDGMSEVIASGTIRTVSKLDESKEKVEERRAELEIKLEALRKDMTLHAFYGRGRILKAFPHLKHRQYGEIYEWLKSRLDHEKGDPE